MKILSKKELEKNIYYVVEKTPIIDVHTHLYSPDFKNFLLWGIDEILTYHYLVAEFFTYEKNISPYEFFKLEKKRQAELIWQKLFLQNTPISEASTGVITILNSLGLDIKSKNLDKIRKSFKDFDLSSHIDNIFKKSNIEYVVMTNNIFDLKERKIWIEKGNSDNKRFKSALRIDDLIFNFSSAIENIKSEGFDVDFNLNEKTIKEIKKFFDKWIKIIKPLYIMCSLPPEFTYPSENIGTLILENIIFPILKEYNLPFALMFGVKRQINPSLKEAGDGVKKIDTDTVLNFVQKYPHLKFLMTFLSRENIFETAVIARKFNNLKLFGCWWFTNIPYLIEEILRIRIELLGTNFIAQHSDARVLEHLIYKWSHFKTILKKVLIEKYSNLLNKGWKITLADIKNDVSNLLHNNFLNFIYKGDKNGEK